MKDWVMKFVTVIAVICSIFLGTSAYAQTPIRLPELSDNGSKNVTLGDQESFVNSNADETERWNFHAQATYILQQKSNFNSAYSGQNSLLSRSEGDTDKSYTLSATAFLGARLWQGAEVFYNFEMFEGTPFGGSLMGLGGFQNGELQKGAFAPPVYYTARAFVRQTFGLGGEQEYVQGSVENHLGGYIDKNRLVFTYGKFAALDFFDKNTYAHDPRTQFQNFSIFSMGAYGYAADGKGFTYGLVGEWYQDDWILKLARMAVPTIPNQMDIDYSLTQDYTNQIELTHTHEFLGQAGAIRALWFNQHAFMATYQDALIQGNQLGLAPNILTARFGAQDTWGYGINVEQAINKDVGVFARWSWNNGQTETQTLDVGSSFSAGLSIKASYWGRPKDTVGLAYAVNQISSSEINYLQKGGYTMFIGDSSIQYQPEQIAEAYYSFHVHKNFSITADYQRIANPAYNSARGPINFFGLRAHIDL